MHVFGPFDLYPLAPGRAYNVAEAPLAAHERMKAQVGLERTVFVQASGHGTDNRAMLAALAEIGPRGRGVAVVAPQTPLVVERSNAVDLPSRAAGAARHGLAALRNDYFITSGNSFQKAREMRLCFVNAHKFHEHRIA